MKPQADTTGLLAAPVRLSNHAWPGGTPPTVSICCITFNHRTFISECIDGFLMQETTFPVEILIHDDASTDGTAAIVAKYQERYPGLIKATLRTENQYSQGKSPGRYLRSIAQGKFIAYCEGDDAWICPSKLQTQYEYLQRFPTAIMAAHDAEVIGSDIAPQSEARSTSPTVEQVPGRDIVAGRYLRMLSVFHRNDRRALAQCKQRRIVNGDRYLFAMLSVYGDTIVSNAKMARYRVHGGGVWSGATKERRDLNIARTRIAIAWDIAPSHCSYACQDLCHRCTPIAGYYSRCHRFYRAIQFLSVLVLCLAISLRTLLSHPKHWSAMTMVQLRIVLSIVKVTGGMLLSFLRLRVKRPD